MSFRHYALLPLVALTLSCGSDSPVQPAQLELVVVSGQLGIDTVETILSSPLVFEVRRGSTPVAGQSVQFERIGEPVNQATPGLTVAKIGESSFQPSATVTTDAQGRASVSIRLGGVTGGARLNVTCVGCAEARTVTYDVEAGNPARVVATARDTSVVIGDTYRVRGTAFDRFGNVRTAQATFESTTSLATVDTSGVVEVGPNTGTGAIVVHIGGLADTARFAVEVGPTLTAVIGSNSANVDSTMWIVTTTLNGLREKKLAIAPGNLGYPVRSPTSDLVAYQRPDTGLQVYLVDGLGQNRRLIPSGQFLETIYPRFAPDGQTIYFTGRTSVSLGIWRVGVDGTGLTSVTLIAGGGPAAPSPDGTRIAYSRRDTITYGERDTMVVRSLGTGAEVPIGPPGDFPVFSANGDRVAWLTGKGDVIVAKADGSSFKHFLPSIWGSGGTNSGLTWLPAGDRLLARGGDGVITIDATTGVFTPMPKLGAYYQLFIGP